MAWHDQPEEVQVVRAQGSARYAPRETMNVKELRYRGPILTQQLSKRSKAIDIPFLTLSLKTVTEILFLPLVLGYFEDILGTVSY